MFLNVFITAIIVLLTLALALIVIAVVFPTTIESIFPNIDTINDYISPDTSDEELIAITTALNSIVHNSLD